jgi:GNAT superfamily N-acetyltransferase
MSVTPENIQIKPGTIQDVPVIFEMIRELAEYEKLAHTVTATEEDLRRSLFGAQPAAEVLLGYLREQCVGFALFFTTYSTFLGKPGLYMEDLFVKPEARGQGVGLALLARVAHTALHRDCGRVEWAVLDWNEQALRFYKNLSARPLDDWTVYRLTGEPLANLASRDS